MTENENDALRILNELHALNKLTDIMVENIGEDLDVDTKALCDKFGIIYTVVTKKIVSK